MGKFAYVNGRYVRQSLATVSIDDRAVQFGDSVYEVFAVCRGKYMDYHKHMQRLSFSLAELGIEMPFSQKVFKSIVKVLIEKNALQNGLVYFQISRGTAPREHAAPKGLKPSIVITTKNLPIHHTIDMVKPLSLMTVKDTRWQRVDIKTVMLLPNCLGKTQAIKAGYDDILFVKDGIVTESSAANFFFVNRENVLCTHPKIDILKGITRHSIIECAQALNIKVREKKFTEQEAKGAKEAFISSATKLVCPVHKIDDVKIGKGDFPIGRKLYEKYMEKTLA